MALYLSLVHLFGLLGNICSCLVSLSPLQPIYLIWKKKTSEGLQSVPHVIALVSVMLQLFYALFKKDLSLLNSSSIFTFFMELGYLSVYLFYATKQDRVFACKFILLFNIGLIIASPTLFLTQGETRVEVLGWVCMVLSLFVFVERLFVVKKVIKIKSVESISFFLSFFLTLSGIMWLGYGYLKKDKFIIIPNILGFIFGILQVVLYMMYRNSKKIVIEAKLTELNEHIVDVEKISPAIGNEVSNV